MDADWSVELGPDEAALEFPWSSPDGSQRYRDLQRHPEVLAEIPEAVQFPEVGDFLRTLNAPASSLLTAKCDVWTEKKVEPTSESVLKGHSFSCAGETPYSCYPARADASADFSARHPDRRGRLRDRGAEGPAFPTLSAASEAMPLQSASPGVKFCSYVDLIFRAEDARFAFDRHEQWVKSAARAFSNDDELPVACEFIVRRCWYHPEISPMREFDDTSSLDGESPPPGFYVTFYLFGYGADETEARKRWAEGLRQVTAVLAAIAA